MRILVADDEPNMRRLIERTLTGLGHTVVGMVGTGYELLAKVNEISPDMVTLNLDMPGPDNYSVATQLCEEHRVAVIVVSGRADIESATQLAERGIGAVVRKPFTPQDIAVAIEVASARFTDLQDLRRQRDEAQRERVRLLQLFSASADGIYMARSDGAMSMINDAALRLLGMSTRGMRGRALGEWATDFKPRDGSGQPLASDALPLPRALQGEVVTDAELWIDALDGTVRCLSLSAAPVTDAEGRVIEAVAVLHDVTQERERERELQRRAERRRRELGLLSSELLAASSASDLAQRCVGRVREALGAERVRMITIGTDGKSRVVSGEIGRPPAAQGKTLPPGGRMGLAGWVLLHGETARIDDLRSERRFEIDEGDALDRSAMAAPLMVGERVLGVMVCSSSEAGAFNADDAHLVTLMANQAAMALENLRLADKLAEQQKLAALGLMAAGVVHEIKNPMSYIQSNIESALELLGQLVDDPTSVDRQRCAEDRQGLIEARNGCSRVFKIVDDIKTYAHPGRAARELNDVNKLVEVALTLAGSELRRWCKVTRDFARLPEVMCDGPKISQVVLNLLVNAAQAVQRSGRPGNVDIRTRIDDGKVRIIIQDDGPGMDAATRDKIFLPFFTTKPAGEGTGLGLAISRRLMESLNGTIDVESTPGAGATFTVVLPVNTPEA